MYQQSLHTGIDSKSRQRKTSDSKTARTVQPQLDIHPQPLMFSEDMSYEQLAVWLTNHPQFVGVDYQQDIRKLKGTY